MKKRKKSKRLTRHHIVNRVNNGSNLLNNILMLNKERHEAWHLLFHNLDIPQIIALLERVKKIKDEIEPAP